MLIPVSVCLSCLFACLFIYLLEYSKSYQQILMKFFAGVRGGPRNSFDFDGDPCHDPDPEFLHLVNSPDPGFLKVFFIYYHDSYRQPRINKT